jgi:signal transduction histidine kinase
LFADLIGFHLDARERWETSESALLDAQETADLREQFIAVLGHDLRNPLASIEGGTRLLQKAALDERSAMIVALMQSSAERMGRLIDDVLDLARGRLGGGLVVDMAETGLAPVVEQVIAELRAARPDRHIEAAIALDRPLRCDPPRIGQLLSNLLANALTHGAADSPVSVRAGIADGRFELVVANAGTPIPPETLDRLFQPFFRAPGRAQHQGLGLGLYISSEIARAHGGRIDVTSTPEETRFTFTMPAA